MPNGLQCWDASANLILDVTDRLTRHVGQFTTTTSNGSRNIGEAGSETEYWIFVIANSANYAFPSVVLNGKTVTWTFPPGVGTWWVPQAATVIYGVM